MARNGVSIRIGTDGKATVIRDFEEISTAGAASAERLSAKWNREVGAVEAAAARANRTAQRLQAVSTSPIQNRIEGATGVSGGSNNAAAAAARALAQELDRAETEARQLIAAIDPLFAAQQRYGARVAQINELKAVGALEQQRYIQLLDAEEAMLNQATMAAQRHGVAVGAGGNRAVMASQQFQDFFIQVQGGGNILVAASQQLSQLSYVMQGSQGAAGRFAAFMSGAWGTAILAGTVILLPLIQNLLDTRTELDKATRELVENARKAELNRQAQATFATTIEGVTEATRRNRETLEELDRAHQTAAERAGISARTQIILASTIRDTTAALLAQARAQLEIERASQGNTAVSADTASAEASRLDAAEARVADLERRLAQSSQQIAENTRLWEDALSRVVVERATARASETPEQRIRRVAREAAEAARRVASAEEVRNGTLTRQVIAINAKADADIRAAQAATRAAQQAEREQARQLVRPTAGALLSPFGADRSGVPIGGQRIAGRRHQGADIRGDVGDAVLAPEGGTAYVRSAPGGLGLYVEIRAESGARDLLAHLSAARVTNGQRVAAGDIVGLVGTSGNAAGGTPHLHWQRQVNGRWVDPMRNTMRGNAAADAARDAQQQLRRDMEESQEFVGRIRQEMDPAAAAAAELEARILGVRRAIANGAVSAGDGQRMIAWLDAQKISDVVSGLDDVERAERAASERRNQELEQLARTNAELDERASLIRFELGLGRMGMDQRQGLVRLEQERLRLQREFGPEHEAEIRQILAKASAEQQLMREVERVRDAQRQLEQVGGQVIDEVFNIQNWDDWGNAGMRVLQMILQEMLTLAAINPLKNMLFNQNNPTFGDFLGGGGGGGGGGSSAATILSDLSSILGSFGGNASGTQNWTGGMTWLAENGPELVNLPRGAKVTPAAETRRLLGVNDNGGRGQFVYNDLRGAVVQEDLYRAMEEGNARAASEGAKQGFAAVLKAHRDSHGRIFRSS